jgi:hypothetical protein
MSRNNSERIAYGPVAESRAARIRKIQMARQALQDVLDDFAPSGASRLANKLGITRAAVAQWTIVPWQWVLKVEHVSGMPRQRLRPDIYPPDYDGAELE